MALICVPVALGLLNAFGQRPSSVTAASDAARLEVHAPGNVRGGLIYEARFHIDALQELEQAVLVLDSGWLEGLTINTIEPSPVGEASRDGRLSLELGHIPRGDRYLLFIQVQVNPTTLGRNSQRVDLYDGDRHLLTVRRQLAIWP